MLVFTIEDTFKISFFTSRSLTLSSFKLDLVWKYTNLIFWTPSWFWKLFIILSRFALGLMLLSLSFLRVVMSMKHLFMIFAIIFFPHVQYRFFLKVLYRVFRKMLPDLKGLQFHKLVGGHFWFWFKKALFKTILWQKIGK